MVALRFLPTWLLVLTLLAGCASTNNADTASDTEDEWATEDEWNDWDDWEDGTWDPLERYNRWVFAFNDVADTYVARPVAVAYRENIPRGIRRPIHNFVNNLREPFNAANHYLQASGETGTRSVTRFAINSTIGIFGLFDVAGAFGLERERTDLGLTLGEWGTPEGPYLVVPLLGPSTLRDASGLAGQYYTRHYHAPMHWADLERPERYSTAVVTGIDARSRLLGLDEMMAETGTDPYVFMRESYLQNRREQLGEDDWDDWDDWDDDEWNDEEEWDDEDDWDEDTEWDDDEWEEMSDD